MALDRIVVVGASQAGHSAVHALRKAGFEGSLTLVGDEHHRPYQRPPLSKEVLSGKWDPQAAALPLDDAALGVDLRLGAPAVSLDLAQRQVGLGDGSSLGWDGLVVATGAAVRTLPGLAPFEGVHYLRTLDDSLAIRAALDARPRVVVIGAGFIGSEVAATCRQAGCEVTVLEALPLPLTRALGPDMGEVLVGIHRDEGVTVRLSATVHGLVGTHRVEGVRVDDETLDADLVVVGVGGAPATGWLEGSGLELRDGVVCDATCRAVGTDTVYAAGDVARWDHPLFGHDLRVEHWDNAVAQGRVAAQNLLAGPGAGEPYDHVPYFWSFQYGARIQFVGTSVGHDRVAVVEGSTADRKFVAAYSREGVLIGALLVNCPHRMPAFSKLVAARTPLGDLTAPA